MLLTKWTVTLYECMCAVRVHACVCCDYRRMLISPKAEQHCLTVSVFQDVSSH